MIKNTKKAYKNIIVSLDDVSISYGKFEAVKNIFCNFKKGDITSLITSHNSIPARLPNVPGAKGTKPNPKSVTYSFTIFMF